MANQKKQLKLAVVDDHNLFRKGLIKLVSLGDKENKYSVLFEAESGIEMKEQILKIGIPDIILLDIDMPDMDGYESAEWLMRNYPEIKILIISMFETEEAVIRMLRMGVKGYLSKDIEVEDIHIAIETIANNGLYYSHSVSEVMAKNIQKGDRSQVDFENRSNTSNLQELSSNEKKFLEFSCTDLTYEDIAKKMYVSPKTIDGYRAALFQKFKVKNRVGLVIYAIKNKLVKI